MNLADAPSDMAMASAMEAGPSRAETDSRVPPIGAWINGALNFFTWTYVASFFISMASMEISAWGAFLFAAIGIFWTRARERKGLAGLGWRAFGFGAIDGPIVALIAVVTIGWAVNGAGGEDLWFILGGIRWIATLYAFAWILRWRRANPRILAPYAFGLIAAGAYGVATYFFDWDFVRHRITSGLGGPGSARAVSFLGFPMTWGHSAAMAFCVGLGVLGARPFNFKSKLGRWACGASIAATVLAAINVQLTYTRGAWIAAAAGALVCAAALGRRWIVGTFVALAVVGGALYATNEKFAERAQTIFTIEDFYSNAQRYQLWQANWLMFKEHPWFGVGLNENERLAGQYLAKLGHPDGFTGHAHNNYLQFLSSSGALGFALFVGVFAWFFVWTARLWRRIPRENAWHRGLALGALGGQAALHAGGLTECNFKAMSVNHHFIFLLAIVAALKQIYFAERSVEG